MPALALAATSVAPETITALGAIPAVDCATSSTPLMLAAKYGDSRVVQLLLDEGADASLRNEQGLTAIDFARRADRDSVAEMIANRLRSLPSAPRW